MYSFTFPHDSPFKPQQWLEESNIIIIIVIPILQVKKLRHGMDE